jgi:cytochrome P450
VSVSKTTSILPTVCSNYICSISKFIFIAREAAEDVIIQGVRNPKGTNVTIFPAAVHHNPAIWGEDCDIFRPERWDDLKTDPDAANSLDHTYAAFSAGPRVCIGKSLAMMEFKIILDELLRRFKFELFGPAQKFEELELQTPTDVLRPKYDMFMRVKKRAV